LEVDPASLRRGLEWIDPDEPTELAIPVAQQKVLRSFQVRA